MAGDPNKFAELFQKKAFEICYAALRVAGISRSAAFLNYLEGYGFMLLDSAIRQESGKALHGLEGIRQFSHIGASAGLVSQRDADILIAESSQLAAFIQDSGNSGSSHAMPESGIQEVFRTKLNEGRKRDPGRIFNKAIISDESSATSVMARSQESSQERHKKMLEKIRQSGNCRIKDLQENFPGVSERTLRYDLQDLITIGKIERFGGGGPATSYRIKEAKKEEIIVLPAAL